MATYSICSLVISINLHLRRLISGRGQTQNIPRWINIKRYIRHPGMCDHNWQWLHWSVEISWWISSRNGSTRRERSTKMLPFFKKVEQWSKPRLVGWYIGFYITYFCGDYDKPVEGYISTNRFHGMSLVGFDYCSLKGAKELFWMYDPNVEKGLVSKA